MSAADTMTASAAPPLWHAAVGGLCALLLGIGLSRFGYTPLIPALIEAGWFDPAEADYLGAANLVGYLIGAALARDLARRLPGASALRGSMLVATLCFFASALHLGFWWYLPWRLAAGVTGGFLMVLAPPAALAAAPPAWRGRVGGLVFTGVGLGIALSGSLLPWLTRFGLVAAWLALGVIASLLTALAWGGLAPTDREQPEAASPSAAPPPSRSGPIRLLLLAYGCAGIGFVPHSLFWVDYIARGLGRGLTVGGSHWLLLGLGAACGPFITGLVAERIGFRRSLALALLGNAAALALPLASTGQAALALSSIGVGSLAIAATSLASGRIGELAGIVHQRPIWGRLTLAYAALYAVFGYVFSFLFVRTGSYALVFACGAGALLLGAVLAWLPVRR